jgi:hypothetical protein
VEPGHGDFERMLMRWHVAKGFRGMSLARSPLRRYTPGLLVFCARAISPEMFELLGLPTRKPAWLPRVLRLLPPKCIGAVTHRRFIERRLGAKDCG